MRERHPRETRPFAEQCYALLLHLYPRAHRREYGPLMRQAFRDHYRETRGVQGRIGMIFWLEVLADEIRSVLREQLASLKGRLFMKPIWTHHGIGPGLFLGLLACGLILWTEVLFPNSDPYSALGLSYPVSLGVLVLFLALVGLLASRQHKRLLSGTRAGAITALLGVGIAILTFFVVDNVWLDVVSHQVDKISGFQHSTYHSMRDYINAGLLWGVVTVLPVMAAVGAVCGTLGAALQKLTNFKRSGA